MAKKDNVNLDATMEENTNLPVSNDNNNLPGLAVGNVSEMFGASMLTMWTSLAPENRAAILGAMQDADFNLMTYFDDNPGVNVAMKDVLIHNVQIADEQTGELITQPRTVIIDDKGKTYASVSTGVLGSLQKIFAIFGLPTYDKPLKIQARRIKTRKFTTINLRVVE